MFTPMASFDFVQQLDPEALGAAIILSVIGTVGALIAISVTLIEAVKTVMLARLSKSMITELLDKGFTPQEVEQLVNGPKKWSKVKNWMAFGKKQECNAANQQPVPPVKTPIV